MPFLAALPAILSGASTLFSAFNKPKGNSQFQNMFGEYMRSPQAQNATQGLDQLRSQYFSQLERGADTQMGNQVADLNRLGLARGSGRVQLAVGRGQTAAQNRLQSMMAAEQVLQQRRAQHQNMMAMLMSAARGEQAMNQQANQNWMGGLAQGIGGVGSGIAHYQNQGNWRDLMNMYGNGTGSTGTMQGPPPPPMSSVAQPSETYYRGRG